MLESAGGELVSCLQTVDSTALQCVWLTELRSNRAKHTAGQSSELLVYGASTTRLLKITEIADALVYFGRAV